MQLQRSSGILLHPTSLPGPQGLGSLGEGARQFVGWLADAGQKLWQVLPLGPTGYGNSPYQCFSAFAGNPLLIDLETLRKERLLTTRNVRAEFTAKSGRIDFTAAASFIAAQLERAFQRRGRYGSSGEATAFKRFCLTHASWLDDFALFMALKERFDGVAWWQWPVELRLRQPLALQAATKELAERIALQKFLQYLFFKQWLALKQEANARGVQIIGDIPIFVAQDSADVWAHPELFLLNKNRRPRVVAGVPPDYFSETGQLWGNPIYDWAAHKRNEYRWWVEVLRSKLELYDFFRIDHFRGFAGYWAIGAREKTAIHGRWKRGPGAAFFRAIARELGELPVIAEDLGVITPDVTALRDRFGFPGMRVLQFAFDSSEDGDHRPHNFVRHSVAYTGTHDNDTSTGWYEKATPEDRRMAEAYMATDGKEISWAFIRCAWASVAAFAIAPMQDVLGLGSDARMNLPGTVGDNWEWRMRADALSPRLADRLRQITRVYSR